LTGLLFTAIVEENEESVGGNNKGVNHELVPRSIEKVRSAQRAGATKRILDVLPHQPSHFSYAHTIDSLIGTFSPQTGSGLLQVELLAPHQSVLHAQLDDPLKEVPEGLKTIALADAGEAR